MIHTLHRNLIVGFLTLSACATPPPSPWQKHVRAQVASLAGQNVLVVWGAHFKKEGVASAKRMSPPPSAAREIAWFRAEVIKELRKRIRGRVSVSPHPIPVGWPGGLHSDIWTCAEQDSSSCRQEWAHPAPALASRYDATIYVSVDVTHVAMTRTCLVGALSAASPGPSAATWKARVRLLVLRRDGQVISSTDQSLSRLAQSRHQSYRDVLCRTLRAADLLSLPVRRQAKPPTATHLRPNYCHWSRSTFEKSRDPYLRCICQWD